MEKNLEKVKKSIKIYNSLSKQDKIDVDKKIETEWLKVFDTFNNLCENDEELKKLHDELKKINGIINFNIKEQYEVYSYTANEGDIEFEEDVYVFSQKEFDNAKYLANNFDAIQDDIKKEIEKIKSSKFGFFKNTRIERLEGLLEDNKRVKEEYETNIERQNLKEYYLKNKATLIDPIKERYNQIVNEYAQKALEEGLSTSPIIACVNHTSFISTSRTSRTYDMTPLNEVCNDIRKEALKEIKTELEDIIEK